MAQIPSSYIITLCHAFRCCIGTTLGYDPSSGRLRKRPASQPHERQRVDSSSRHREEQRRVLKGDRLLPEDAEYLSGEWGSLGIFGYVCCSLSGRGSRKANMSEADFVHDIGSTRSLLLDDR